MYTNVKSSCRTPETGVMLNMPIVPCNVYARPFHTHQWFSTAGTWLQTKCPLEPQHITQGKELPWCSVGRAEPPGAPTLLPPCSCGSRGTTGKVWSPKNTIQKPLTPVSSDSHVPHEAEGSGIYILTVQIRTGSGRLSHTGYNQWGWDLNSIF